MEKKLEVKNLRISFRTNNGTVKAVRDISFTINKGETLAIVGESGSGKSVTARAIMGILAGNSIVEGGEIFYDGRDLLKISEEDFHEIRGNRIAMIFQDPLSSLNPIMRVGQQMTEAMIINGKANQKDAGKEFKNKEEYLRKAMTAAAEEKGVGAAQAKHDINGHLTTLDRFVKKGNELEAEYNTVREQIVSSASDFDGLLVDIILGKPKVISRLITEQIKQLDKVYHRYLIRRETSDLHTLAEKLDQQNKAYAAGGDAEPVKETMGQIRDRLLKALERPVPNFFRMGYYVLYCPNAQVDTDGIEALNEKMLAFMNEKFMEGFIEQVAAGIEYSARQSLANKRIAADQMDKTLAEFAVERIPYKLCEERGRELIRLIELSIDRLAIRKDSIAYTFRNAMNNALSVYHHATQVEHRNRKFMRKKEKLFYDNIDMELFQSNIRLLIERARDSYRADLSAAQETDYRAAAVEMVDYLKGQASRMVNHVSHRMARVRALDLMEEVGIPEARRRFHQYPFEFSGGMRQRVVIAIALSANPDILICDEPTTALDVTIQAQILDLINGLKRERQLTVIFITHDLGVVANMADSIAVMYAGKIVEEGLSDEVFYHPAHPYTWALLASMPDLDTKEKLEAIPGTPPNMIFPPKGDAFAARNKYAMAIDFEEEPPLFEITKTHRAATWLLHPDAPKVEPPYIVTERIERMTKMGGNGNG